MAAPNGTGGIAGTATSRRGSSSGGTGGTGGGNGSTSGGQGVCNNNPGSCPPPGTRDPLGECQTGQLELVANLVDFNFTTNSSAVTCPIVLSDVADPGLSVTTDLCGYIRYCVAPETEISFIAKVNGYVPLHFATLIVDQSAQIPNLPGIPMAKNALLDGLTTFLPNADTKSHAMVIVDIQPVIPSPQSDAGYAAQACASKQGWTIWLVDSSGDPVDAGIAYLVNDTLDPTAGGTDPTGFVFFYNIDPGLGTVQPRGYRARDALSDGGVLCGNPESGPPLGFTGSVPLAQSELSVIPYVEGPN